jgi:hypothetical protein
MLTSFVDALRAAHAEAIAELRPGSAPPLTLFEDAADQLELRGMPDGGWPPWSGLLSVLHAGMALPDRARFGAVILQHALRDPGEAGLVAEALLAYADEQDAWLVLAKRCSPCALPGRHGSSGSRPAGRRGRPGLPAPGRGGGSRSLREGLGAGAGSEAGTGPHRAALVADRRLRGLTLPLRNPRSRPETARRTGETARGHAGRITQQGPAAMKRTALIALFVWLGLLFGFAFGLPSARSASPSGEPVPLAWVGEALDSMPFILSGRR